MATPESPTVSDLIRRGAEAFERAGLAAASIGITIYPNDDQEIDDLLRHADAAMYRAKQRGNSFQFHIPNTPPSPALLFKQS